MSITGHVTIVNCDAPNCLEVEMIDMQRDPGNRFLWIQSDVTKALKRLGWRVTITGAHHYCPKHAKTAACNTPAAVLK